jgi:hypothetical protein
VPRDVLAVRRSGGKMKRNADIGRFTQSSILFDFAFRTKVYFTPMIACGIDVTHGDII